MVQFRKSKKIGPIRITASKNGIGISAGAGPVRVSRGPDGKVRRTISAPGTGIYDTRVIGSGQRNQGPPPNHTSPPQADPAGGVDGYQPTMAPAFRCHPVALPQPISVKGYNGTITFDGATVQFTRKGIAAKAGRLRDTTFPITAVNAIDWKEPTMAVNGHLRFCVPLADGSLPSPVPVPENQFALLVTKQQRKRFDEILGALNATMQNPPADR